MKHISKSGKSYEIGQINEYRGTKTYDLVVIMDWNDENAPPIMVDFYFGDYEYEITEEYIQTHENDNAVGE